MPDRSGSASLTCAPAPDRFDVGKNDRVIAYAYAYAYDGSAYLSASQKSHCVALSAERVETGTSSTAIVSLAS